VQNSDRETPRPTARLRCAIYTRKSTEEGLDQEFNSLDAQREAAEAFIPEPAARSGKSWMGCVRNAPASDPASPTC
jgi:site-specific DNA recombinase